MPPPAAATSWCAASTPAISAFRELGDGREGPAFSVWDASDKNDPNAVEEEKRVKVLQKDEKVRVGRFGNEGTGAQSFFDYDWKPGETYRFLVTAKPDGQRTAFTAYFYVPEDKDWKRLATLSTIAGGKGLRGYYSFIEDFRRNRISAGEVRTAHYGNGWIKTKDGQWAALTRARFTGDANPVKNVNADVDGDRFLLRHRRRGRRSPARPSGTRWTDRRALRALCRRK